MDGSSSSRARASKSPQPSFEQRERLSLPICWRPITSYQSDSITIALLYGTKWPLLSPPSLSPSLLSYLGVQGDKNAARGAKRERPKPEIDTLSRRIRA